LNRNVVGCGESEDGLAVIVDFPKAARQPARATDGERILFVRHGPGRGPHIRLSRFRPKIYQPMLDEFAIRYPELRQAIDVWETGTAPPPLDKYAAVVCVLCDPLRELYPECYRDASAVAEQANRLGIRVVNPPDALSNSIKSRQADLLTRAGIPTPKHVAFRNRQELVDAVRQVQFPAIVRADLLHAQQSMRLCRTAEEVLALREESIAYPGAIAELVDTREGFRKTMPGTPWATHFHKKRAFVFGEHVVNNHVFFGNSPIVGGKTSTFGHYQSLNPIRRMLANAACREHIELDYAYFRKGEEHSDQLRKVSKALGQEFVAIDYSCTADGGIVVWEANPHFCLYPWPFEVLARQRRLRERHGRFHEAIQQFFVDLQRGTR
jgi:hypothetical protein